jgi:hypothetical protein
VGFHGVFDAEFMEHDGRRLLIDVNPRFYNHMAFEVERGLALPWLTYLGATGNRDGLRAAVDTCKRAARMSSLQEVYVHRLPLRLMLAIQALTGGMSRDERRRWRAWVFGHEGYIIDPVYQADDPWPALAELALELRQFIRHPRSYLRLLARSGAEAYATRSEVVPERSLSEAPRGA